MVAGTIFADKVARREGARSTVGQPAAGAVARDRRARAPLSSADEVVHGERDAGVAQSLGLALVAEAP